MGVFLRRHRHKLVWAIGLSLITIGLVGALFLGRVELLLTWTVRTVVAEIVATILIYSIVRSQQVARGAIDCVCAVAEGLACSLPEPVAFFVVGALLGTLVLTTGATFDLIDEVPKGLPPSPLNLLVRSLKPDDLDSAENAPNPYPKSHP